MALPPDRTITFSEKLSFAAGISRRLRLVRDSARFEWQPAIEQLKQIDANTFNIVLEFKRMISSFDCHGSTPGGGEAAATATRYRQ
jgi:hypothetical protein